MKYLQFLTQTAKMEFKKVNTLLEKMNQSLGFLQSSNPAGRGKVPESFPPEFMGIFTFPSEMNYSLLI